MTTAEKKTSPADFVFRISDLNTDVNEQINGLYQQLVALTPRNELRASFYDGKYAIKQMGDMIPPEYLRTATVLGWSAKSVDTLARRCNLEYFFWPDGKFESIGGDELWEENFFATKANSAMVSSLMHGPAFLINTEGGDNEPKSLIHVKSALNGTGTYSARASRLTEFLSITARNEAGEPTGIAVYEDGITVTADFDEKTRKWDVDIQSHKLGMPVEMLPYRPREDRQTGSSRISRPIMSLQHRALKTCIRMDGHADAYSWPTMILLGANPKAFKNADGSLKPAWQIALARVFALEDDKDEPDASRARADVKRFEAASPKPHIEQLEQIAQMFSGESSIPVESLGIANRANPTSADSYIASREDMIAEAEGAVGDWSPAFRRSYIRGLAIKNGLKEIPDTWKTIDSQFRSPIYLSAAAKADAGSKMVSSGPEWLKETEVGLELLGLTPQQIKRAMAEKRRATSLSLVQALTQPQAPADDEDQAVDEQGDDTAADDVRAG